MAVRSLISNSKLNFILFQCLGWGTLFGLNFSMMWLSGDPARERSLNILVFLILGFGCSFILRRLLKPISQQANYLTLIATTSLYSFVMAAVTVQAGMILLHFLPTQFGGEANLDVNILLVITMAWTLIFAVWSLIYLFVQRQKQLVASKGNERKLDLLLNEAKLNNLHNQINPHFIFNAINNIRALMLEDKSRSRDMLAHLSDILRYALDSKKSTVPVNEELEIVEDYLELCKIQFESRLNIKLHVEDACRAIRIPRMLIQLLVENAVKHGIAECIGEALLFIEIKMQEQALSLRVVNSGRLEASQAKDSTGIGLTNIRERLDLLYGLKAKFILKQEGKNVVAQVNIPINTLSEK